MPASFSQQIAHLRKDRLLRSVIDAHGPVRSKRENDLYLMLLRAIAGQQLSVKAAQTIWDRFLKLFRDQDPHPGKVLRLDAETMRQAGLSYQKAGYIQNIARFSSGRKLDYQLLKNKSDEELIDYLVQIKGVGRWTVEMILMFGLNRLDVFPKDDLGIQTGMRKLYGIEAESKRALLHQMEAIAEKWRPYRTLACKYIWKYKDAKPL